MMIGRFYGGMNTLYDETYLVIEVLEKAEQEQEEADKLKTQNALNQD